MLEEEENWVSLLKKVDELYHMLMWKTKDGWGRMTFEESCACCSLTAALGQQLNDAENDFVPGPYKSVPERTKSGCGVLFMKGGQVG